MHFFGQDLHAFPGFVLIIIAGATLYIASRSAADALAGAVVVSPGRMSLGHWVPIAAVALGAMVLRRSDIALGVVFATSVASLSLAAGAVTFLAPPAVPVWARRTWPMVLPAALLTFLAGFRGEFTIYHAAILLVEGLLILLLWTGKESGRPGDKETRRPAGQTQNSNDPSSSASVPVSPPLPFSLSSAAFRTVQLILAAALAAIGAWAAVRGADVGSSATRTIVYGDAVASPGLLAATILSPLLVLPMLGAGVDLAHRGQSWLALSAQVGVVLLNLCLLLPLVVIEGNYHPLRQGVEWAMQQVNPPMPPLASPIWPTTMAATNPATMNSTATVSTTLPTTTAAATSQPTTMTASAEESDDEPSAAIEKTVTVPLAVWRVDIIMLIALGLFLLPVALGRWSLTKLEGLGLIGAYIAYLLLSMALGVRMI